MLIDVILEVESLTKIVFVAHVEWQIQSWMKCSPSDCNTCCP